jgi:MYXO-CTERM domain-containing protein
MIAFHVGLLLIHSLTYAAPVVGGSQAPEGMWDDCAAIYFGNDVGCTGTLIAPNVVLTASHCIGGISKVKLATNDWRQQGEEIRVIQQIGHPQHWSNYDVGVLVLQHDAETEPRPIAQGCILDEYLYDGADVAIVGYGAIDQWGNQYVPQLQEAYTTVTDHDCSDISSGCYPAISPGGEIGAGGSGIDACYGDSGGPLYLITERGNFLVGVTSRAFSYVTVPCRDGGIYVRPDAVIDWIEAQTGVEIPTVSCNEPPAPTVKRIEVEAGRTASVRIQHNDPDDDEHSYEVVEQPDHGKLEVFSEGMLRMTADKGDDAVGPDWALVQVSDGEYTVDLEVPIEIQERSCGCAAGTRHGAGLSLALLGLLGLARRRRRD